MEFFLASPDGFSAAQNRGVLSQETSKEGPKGHLHRGPIVRRNPEPYSPETYASYMSYSLKSLRGVYMAYIGDYFGVRL